VTGKCSPIEARNPAVAVILCTIHSCRKQQRAFACELVSFTQLSRTFAQKVSLQLSFTPGFSQVTT